MFLAFTKILMSSYSSQVFTKTWKAHFISDTHTVVVNPHGMLIWQLSQALNPF